MEYKSTWYIRTKCKSDGLKNFRLGVLMGLYNTCWVLILKTMDQAKSMYIKIKINRLGPNHIHRARAQSPRFVSERPWDSCQSQIYQDSVEEKKNEFFWTKTKTTSFRCLIKKISFDLEIDLDTAHHFLYDMNARDGRFLFKIPSFMDSSIQMNFPSDKKIYIKFLTL